MSIKAAIFDVDGTLTSSIDGTLVESTIEACRQLQKKGIKVIIASGRAPYSIEVITNKIYPDYYISSNGSNLADSQGQTFYACYFEKGLFEEVNEYCQKNQIGIFWKFLNCCYCYSSNAMMEALANNIGNFVISANPDPNALPTAGSFNCPANKIDAFYRRFGERTIIVNGGFDLYDIGLLNVSKATGLKRLLDIIGLDTSECIAFGDSENDIDILKAAGISVAMGNAFDSVKAICDYVTDNSEDNGILNALKKLNLL